MEICYNVMGTRRKKLVDVIAETTGARAEYQFMPTCSYVIDYFTVTKDGTLIFDDRADSEEVERVLEAIVAAGFACTPACGADEESGELSEETETAPHGAIVALTVEIPADKVNVDNLTKLLEAKGGLIKKALGVNNLPVEVGEESVAFPGHGGGASGGQRKIRLPLLPSPAGIHRRGVQGGAKDSAPQPLRLIGVPGRQRFRFTGNRV